MSDPTTAGWSDHVRPEGAHPLHHRVDTRDPARHEDRRAEDQVRVRPSEERAAGTESHRAVTDNRRPLSSLTCHSDVKRKFQSHLLIFSIADIER